MKLLLFVPLLASLSPSERDAEASDWLKSRGQMTDHLKARWRLPGQFITYRGDQSRRLQNICGGNVLVRTLNPSNSTIVIPYLNAASPVTFDTVIPYLWTQALTGDPLCDEVEYEVWGNELCTTAKTSLMYDVTSLGEIVVVQNDPAGWESMSQCIVAKSKHNEWAVKKLVVNIVQHPNCEDDRPQRTANDRWEIPYGSPSVWTTTILTVPQLFTKVQSQVSPKCDVLNIALYEDDCTTPYAGDKVQLVGNDLQFKQDELFGYPNERFCIIWSNWINHFNPEKFNLEVKQIKRCTGTNPIAQGLVHDPKFPYSTSTDLLIFTISDFLTQTLYNDLVCDEVTYQMFNRGCTEPYDGIYLTFDAATGEVRAKQDLLAGWMEEVCFLATNSIGWYSPYKKDNRITQEKAPDCPSSDMTPTLVTQYSINYLSTTALGLMATTVPDLYTQSLQNIVLCDEVIYALYDSDCTTAYSGTRLTFSATGQIEGKQDEVLGYTENVCVGVSNFINSFVATTKAVTVTQLKMCVLAAMTPTSVTEYIINYASTATFSLMATTVSDIFTQTLDNIALCDDVVYTLYDSDCSTVYSGTRVTLSATGQFEGKQDEPAGYTENVCVGVSNANNYFVAATKAITVTQVNSCASAAMTSTPMTQYTINFQSITTFSLMGTTVPDLFTQTLGAEPVCDSVIYTLYDSDCITAYSGTRVTISATGQLEGKQDVIGGYTENICVGVSSTAAYSFPAATKAITVQQLDPCPTAAMTPTLVTQYTITYQSTTTFSLMATTVSDVFTQTLENKADCDSVIYTLYDSDCTTAYLGARVTISATGQLEGKHDEPAGYTENICVGVSNLIDSFIATTKALTVTQPNPCASAAMTQTSLSQYTFNYQATTALNLMGTTVPDLFTQTLGAAPFCDSVIYTLFDSDCITAYSGARVTISATGQLEGKQDEIIGYSEKICVGVSHSLSSSFASATKIVTVNQLFLPCQISTTNSSEIFLILIKDAPFLIIEKSEYEGWFSSNLPRCITQALISPNQDLSTSNAFSEVNLNTLNDFQIETTVPSQYKSVFLGYLDPDATTPQAYSRKITYKVCGLENVQTSNLTVNTTLTEDTGIYSDTWVFTSDDSDCPVVSVSASLLNGQPLPPEIIFNQSISTLHVSTLIEFYETTVELRAVTASGVEQLSTATYRVKAKPCTYSELTSVNQTLIKTFNFESGLHYFNWDFQSNDTECPIERISAQLKNDKELPSPLHFIESNGTLVVSTSSPLSQQNIIITAHTQSSLTLSKSALISIKSPILVQNQMPSFDSDLEDYIVTIAPGSSSNETISLPEMSDPEGDSINVEMINLTDFMQYDSKENVINLVRVSKADVGNYSITILLFNTQEMKRQYQLMIEVKLETVDLVKTNAQIVFEWAKNLLNFNISKSEDEKDEDEDQEAVITYYRARIKDIDSEGRVLVRFNTSMNNQFANVSEINNSSLNLTVIKSEESIELLKRQLDKESIFEMLAFNWTCVNYTKYELELKLTFEYPIAISQGLSSRDVLQIEILDFHIINASNPMIIYDKKFLTIQRPMVKLLQKDGFSTNLSAFGSISSSSLYIVSLLQLSLNFFVNFALSIFFQSMECLQVVLFQSFINNGNPANVVTFEQTLIKVLEFEVLNPEWTTEYVWDFLPDYRFAERALLNDFGSLMNFQLFDIGFETFNPVLNAGGLFWMISLTFVLVIMVHPVKQLKKHIKIIFLKLKTQPQPEGGQLEGNILIKNISTKKSNSLSEISEKEEDLEESDKQEEKRQKDLLDLNKEIRKSLDDRLLFNIPLKMIFETMFQLHLAVRLFWNYLSINDTPREDSGWFITQLFGWFCVFCVFFLPILCFTLMQTLSNQTLYDTGLKDRIGVVYLQLRQGKIHLVFILIYILRRYTIVELIFEQSMSQGLKLIFIFYLNLICFIYTAQASPYLTKERNKSEMINEFMISILTFEQVAFTDFVGVRQAQAGLPGDINDVTKVYEAKYLFGWIKIATIIIVIYLNFGQILRYQLRVFILYLTKKMNICCYKKRKWIEKYKRKEPEQENIISVSEDTSMEGQEAQGTLKRQPTMPIPFKPLIDQSNTFSQPEQASGSSIRKETTLRTGLQNDPMRFLNTYTHQENTNDVESQRKNILQIQKSVPNDGIDRSNLMRIPFTSSIIKEEQSLLEKGFLNDSKFFQLVTKIDKMNRYNLMSTDLILLVREIFKVQKEIIGLHQQLTMGIKKQRDMMTWDDFCLDLEGMHSELKKQEKLLGKLVIIRKILDKFGELEDAKLKTMSFYKQITRECQQTSAALKKIQETAEERTLQIQVHLNQI